MRFCGITLVVCLLTACALHKKPVSILDTKHLKIQPLTEGVYVHISFLDTEDFGHVACNGMIYVRGGEAIVFDTPTDSATSETLIHFIETRWKTRVKAVVVNHFHNDCLGGLAAFHRRRIPSYANRLTIQLAGAKANVVLPQNGFDQELTLQCGDRTVENRFWGEGHTRDNIVSYLPSEKALFGGCMVKALNAGKGFLGDANTAAWPATAERVKQAYPDVQFVVPGHGAPGSSALLDYTAKLFRENKQD